MDHMVLFGGSAVAIAHMFESGVPDLAHLNPLVCSLEPAHLL